MACTRVHTYVCALLFMATCVLPLYSCSTDDSHSSFRCCCCIGSPCCTLSTFDHVINKFDVSTVRASNLINAGLDWTPASFIKCRGPRGPEGNKCPGIYSRKYGINILLVKFSDLCLLFYDSVAFLGFSIRSLNSCQSGEFSMYVLMTISDENVPANS